MAGAKSPGFRAALALALFGCLALASMPSVAAGSSDAEQVEAREKLDAVRDQIRTISDELTAIKGQQSDAVRELRGADRSVSDAVASLRETEAALTAQRGRLDELQQQRETLGNRLSKQRDALASLVRMAYALGRDQRLKLLLAQDRLDQAARALAYQRYFQRDQIERIRQLLGDLEALRALGEAVEAQTVTLDRALQEQQQAVTELSNQRVAQQAVVDLLNQRYQDSEKRLAALGRDEKELLALIARLRDVFADIPKQETAAQPLAKLQGKLSWPLSAPIRVAFGGKLPDGRDSRGWLMGASKGTEVRAVANGRIAFADWLRGYGLIVIVDHGDGYMSLYAQNESLLRDVGDWVAAGDVLSTVGSSGGQGQSSLYFELRHDSKPVDPKRWLSRR